MSGVLSRFVVVSLVACALVAEPMHSQEQKEPEEPQEQKAEKAPTTSEEIVVTARKREEVVQDVPFSVVAPSEERLRDLGAETIEDVAANIAGFSVQNLGPGQSQVAMRGVSAGQIVRDQPGVKEQVGVYLDESVISLSLFTPDIDLFDTARVEVLRGPQGTLFGSGSLSGTVRYITHQPELGISDTTGEINFSSIDGGSQGGHAKVALNVPMGDTAAMRLTAYYSGFAGYIDAVQPDLSLDRDVNGGDRAGARLAFKFQPSDRLTITPRLIYQEINMDGWNRRDDFNILANPYTTTRPAVSLGEREQFIQIEEPYTDEFLLGDLAVEYDFGSMQFTSITSYTDRDILVVRDATALTASITGGSIGLGPEVYEIDSPLDDWTKASGITQEFRLGGVSGATNWVAGVFYSDFDRDYGQVLFVDGFTAVSGIESAGNFGAAEDELYWSDLSYEFKQLAVFGEVTWSANDKLDLTGGLRWYDFDEDRVQTFDGIFADPGTTVGSTTADGIAPRVMMSYRLSGNTNLNAQISKGFRLGGINDPLNVPLCTPQDLVTFGGRDTWDDEELWNYEVGAKTKTNGGRGALNAALFYMDISDLQATVTAGSCSSRIIFNVPKAKSTGVELEYSLLVNNNFDIALSASYTDSKLESTVTSTDANGNVTVVAGIEKGNRLPTVPEFQGAAAAVYRWTMGHVGMYVSGVYQHVGSRYTQIGDQADGFGTVNLYSFDPNNIGGPFTQDTFTFDPELPAYDLVNLRFGILVGKWDTAFFVNNVTDEVALLALDQERGTRARVGYLTNQPRTFGISARVHF